MVALGVMGWAYARVVGPLAQPAENAPIPNVAAPVGLPDTFADAGEHLADGEWIDRARVQVRRGDSAIMLFDDAEPVEDSEDGVGLVRLAPFAIISQAEPGQPPYIVQCDAARLKFEGDFKSITRGGKIGRLLGGSLDGRVTITGPDELQLVGRDFILTEDMLFSDQAVAFAFGSVQPAPPTDETTKPDRSTRVDGRADKIQIALHKAASPETSLLPRDLPRIAGFRSFWLRRNVEITLRQSADPGDPQSTPEAVCLASDGRLEYLVADRTLRLEDNVTLHHLPPEQLAQWPPTGVIPIDPDRLDGDSLTRCEQIALSLQPDPAVEEPTLIGNLELDLIPTRVRAFGSPLLQVAGRDAVASGHELRYVLADRVVSLLGRETTADENAAQPLDVRLSQNGRVLFAESIDASLTEANELEQVVSRGSGVFVEVTPGHEADAHLKEHQTIKARWADGLTLGREDDGYRLDLAGQVQLDELAHGIRFGADRVSARLNDTGGERFTDDGRCGLESVVAWTDDGVVTLASPDAIVTTKKLRVDLERAPLGTVASADDGSAAAIFDRSPKDEPATPEAVQPKPVEPSDPVLASADEIAVRFLVDEVTQSLSTLSARGRVAIAGARDEEAAVAIGGETATLSSRGGSRQIVTLTGTPARVDVGEMQFRSPQLIVDRAAGTVTSPGGSARLPMKTALAGEKTQKAATQKVSTQEVSTDRPDATPSEPLLVDWAGSMAFDGRQVELSERVRARQGETQIQCERLTVELSRPLDLAADRPDTADLDYQRILCRHNVQLTSKEWHQTEMLTLRQARAAEIVFDRPTGQMTAQGPGHLRQWSRDRQPVLPTTPRAAANRGGRADTQRWQFVDLQFEGEAIGWATQKRVKLTRRVELLHSSVDSPLELVNRETTFDAPEVPADAFWLTCHELEANLVDGEPITAVPDNTAPNQVQVQARGQVRMEGRQFVADADRLSYNQLTGDFFLHGEGDHRATVSVMSRPGVYDPAEARLIRINPEKRQFIADGARGFWTSQ